MCPLIFALAIASSLGLSLDHVCHGTIVMFLQAFSVRRVISLSCLDSKENLAKVDVIFNIKQFFPVYFNSDFYAVG